MYQLDPQEARRADSTGNWITDIGKYVGTFTQAADITASTGTKGVSLVFESADGKNARLSFYTVKSTGEKLMGYQVLMAIMTCLSLRSIEPKPGQIKRWNADAHQEETVAGDIFPALMNKPIGLLLETEDYEKKNGDTGTRMVIKGVFQAGSELTASEILDKKTIPAQLEKMVALLRHRPLKSGTAKPIAPMPPTSGSFDSLGDDIPF